MRLSAIDLFAGAGGFSLAAMNAGFQIRAAVEVDQHAANTYRTSILGRAHTRIHLHVGDIRELSWSELLTSAELKPGECDLLLGGPPCQGFSTHRINDAGVGDPRNELLFSYFAGVKAINPKLFLVENVSGLLWPRHVDYLDRFMERAKKAGYLVKPPILLNARDYGVPQNRKRVFVLGIRKDIVLDSLAWPPPATHFRPDSDEVLINKKLAWRVARSVFVRIPAGDPNNKYMRPTPELLRVFASTPQNGGSRSESSRVLSCHEDHDGHKDVYGRIDPRRPGPTMTSGCINPSKGRFVHPTANHGITARHAARFQSFPDDFTFSGGLTAAGFQIGNAVPPLLGEILIKTLRAQLEAVERRNGTSNRR